MTDEPVMFTASSAKRIGVATRGYERSPRNGPPRRRRHVSASTRGKFGGVLVHSGTSVSATSTSFSDVVGGNVRGATSELGLRYDAPTGVLTWSADDAQQPNYDFVIAVRADNISASGSGGSDLNWEFFLSRTPTALPGNQFLAQGIAKPDPLRQSMAGWLYDTVELTEGVVAYTLRVRLRAGSGQVFFDNFRWMILPVYTPAL